MPTMHTSLCPYCRNELKMPDTILGKRIRCVACQKTFTASTEPPTPSGMVRDQDRDGPAAPLPVVTAAPDDDRDVIAAPPPKRSHAMLFIVLGVGAAAVVLLLGCVGVVGGGAALFLIPTRNEPSASVTPKLDGGPSQNNDIKPPPVQKKDPQPPQDPNPPPRDPNPPKDPKPNPGPMLNEPTQEVALSGAAEEVAVGGGGRYLVLHLPTVNKLAVFDTNEGKVIKELPVKENEIHFAANQTQLVVLYPQAKIIDAFTLATGDKQGSAPYPPVMKEDDIRQVCMGSASNGPLFVYHPKKKLTLAVNLTNMAVAQVQWKHWAPNNAYGPMHMRASPDGGLLVGWTGGWAGMEVASFQNGRQTGSNDKYEFSNGLYALPSPNGRLIYTPWGINPLIGMPLKNAAFDNAYLVPAQEAGYFLSLKMQNLPSAAFEKKDLRLGEVTDATVYTEDGKPYFSLRGCPEIMAGNDLHWEKRVFYYPASARLIALTAAKDRLVIRRLDVPARQKML